MIKQRSSREAVTNYQIDCISILKFFSTSVFMKPFCLTKIKGISHTNTHIIWKRLVQSTVKMLRMDVVVSNAYFCWSFIVSTIVLSSLTCVLSSSKAAGPWLESSVFGFPSVLNKDGEFDLWPVVPTVTE